MRELLVSIRHRGCVELSQLLRVLRNPTTIVERVQVLLEPAAQRPMNHDFVVLVPGVADVQQENEHQIAQWGLNVHMYAALDYFSHTHQQMIRSYFNSFSGLPEQLGLAVGMKVLLIKNLTIEALQMRNGMFGEVVGLEENHMLVNFIDYPGITVLLSRYCFVCQNTGIHRFQFPVIPAYAMTIHRVQSQTLPGINIKLNSLFVTGMAYPGYPWNS